MTFSFTRDTLENWVKNNPVLALNQIGLILPSGEFKVGDGVKRFAELEISTTLPETIPLCGIPERHKPFWKRK